MQEIQHLSSQQASTQENSRAAAVPGELRAVAEIELFARSFAGWRVAIGSAITLGLLVGWVFHFLTDDSRLWVWAGMLVVAYLVQAAACWRYERRKPEAGSPAEERWQQVWIAMTFLTGLISGGLMWFLPPENLGLLLSAAVLAGIFAIGEVMASGRRSLVYAAMASQTLMVCMAMAFHAHLPLGILVAALYSMLVLYFGLQLNQSMLGQIEQRLLAEQLAKQLQAEHQLLVQTQREQLVLQERQRVMQDLHDGLGSSLSSSLVMLERGGLTVAGAASVLRECVDDLRLVVDSLEPSAHDLATMLGMLRYRLQRRIHSAGVTLHWQMGDLPGIDWMDSSLALELLRLVQEAIANALVHADATILDVSTRLADNEVELVIRDNGKGFVVQPETGRGMRTMKTRAARLGSRLAVRSSPGEGTEICLSIPVVRNFEQRAQTAI